MDVAEYHRRIDEALERVVRALEALEEVESTAADGLVTIAFEDGTRWVLNRQSGNQQLWLAAGARAWHYRWDPGAETWRDDRDGHEIWRRLEALLGDKLGRTVQV